MAFDFNNFGTKEQKEQLKAKQPAVNFSFENFGQGETAIPEKVEASKFSFLNPETSDINQEDKLGTKYIQNLWSNYYSSGKGLQETVIKGAEKLTEYSPEAIKAKGENPFVGLAKYLGTLGEIGLQVAGKGVGAVFSPLTALGQTAVPQEEDEGLGAEVTRGAITGAPFGPGGAAVGSALALVFHGVNSVMEQPQIKEFLDKNPNIKEDIDAAVNVGLATLGTKAKGKVVEKVKGMTEIPIEQYPAELAKSYAKPALAITGGVAKVTNKLARFGTSQATGLSSETISTIMNEMSQIPKEELKGYTRESVANEALSAINKRLTELTETGKEYGTIRTENVPLKLKPNEFQKLISENTGLKISANGKILSGPSAEIRSSADVSKLQTLYNRYQPLYEKGQMDTNQYLNLRQDLATLAKFEGGIGRSAPLENLTGIMRAKLNEAHRTQVPGLKELDIKFGSESKELKIIKKDFFNKDGTIKDNAISKIANLTGKGKEALAERLEKISPGVIRKVKIVKALEDINLARSQKVGTYLRGATGGFLLSGGNAVAAILSAILSSPDMAVPILRGYGKLLGVKEAALNKIIGDVQQYLKNPKVGGMMEDINKLSDVEIKQRIVEAKKYLTKMSDNDIRYTFKENIYNQISEYESILKERQKEQGGLNFKKGETSEQQKNNK
jgi:hypothetical protein